MFKLPNLELLSALAFIGLAALIYGLVRVIFWLFQHVRFV